VRGEEASVADTTRALADEAVAVGNRVPVPAAHGRRFGDTVRQTLDYARRARLPAYAGNLAYHTLFACIPGLFTLFWLLEAVGGGHAVQSALGLLGTALPHRAAQAIQAQLGGAGSAQARGAITGGAVLAGLTTLWALAEAVQAAMLGLNTVYELEERRPFLRRFLVALALGIGMGLLLLGALVVAVFGTAMTRHLGQASGIGLLWRWAWTVVSWPLLVLAALAAFALVYAFAPARPPVWRWARTGAIAATAFWLLFTLVFALYINRFAAPGETYGALAGIAVLMLYLYGTAVVLLLGAALDRVLEPEAGAPAATDSAADARLR